ncbi:helix-turn-helix domain-containing protein [Gorillibacterium sp. sgz500922]|uniref:helix-turn-helix domain-containing protein n=1 Tax=Gorillibacterium sp. sgz500922 TaxID=3446694 RepID=UPI003F6669CE
MERESAILEMVDHYLSHSGFTLTQFAERSGLRSGTLSNLIHGRRPLSIRQLDLNTAGLNREEGTLYEQYIDEHI